MLNCARDGRNPVERRNKTKEMLSTATSHFLSAFENVEKHSKQTKYMLRQTKQKLRNELEKKRQRTRDIITKAKSEILYAIEEQEQRLRKNENLSGGRVIPVEAVDHFRKPYAYNASCGSVLELLFFQRFWMRLSTKVPSYIMPGTITMTGVFINIATCCIVLCYSPDFVTEVPSWALFLCGVGLFLYQTLDALDGKQAAKLQNTHLEELFDHGADSLSTSFIVLTVAAAMQLGSGLTMFLIFFSTLLVFYSTHWQTHVTDIVVFGKVDVTEAQIAMVFVHFISAFCGQWIWSIRIDLVGLKLSTILIGLSVVGTIMAFIGNVKIILGGSTPLDSFTNIPRKQGITKFYPLVPILLWVLLAVHIAYFTDSFRTSPAMFALVFGFAFSKLLMKLQISTMGRMAHEFVDSVLLAPLLMCLNAHVTIVPEQRALFCGLMYTLTEFLRYATYLCWDVCDFQDIWAFSLKYPVGHSSNRAGSNGIYINGVNNEEIIAKCLMEAEQEDCLEEEDLEDICESPKPQSDEEELAWNLRLESE